MTESKDSKKMSAGFKWFWTVSVILILIFSVGACFNLATRYSKEDYNTAIKDAETKVTTEKDAIILNLTETFEIFKAEQTIQEEIIQEETEKTLWGYLVDGLLLETFFGDVYSDRELNLFDGEVEFDGDEYDAEETFTTNGLVMRANENDFLGNPYLVVPEGAITYSLVFEDSLNTSLIEDDETLVFNLLGKEVEISKWDVDEVTFTRGNEQRIIEGESVTFEGKEIVLDMVLVDSIYVLVDGVGERIFEGHTKKVNELEIKVTDVLYSAKSGSVSKVYLVIGEDVEKTVSDGEEYEEDSIWEWVIDEHSMGLVLVEEFVELDEDEDYNALTVDEKVCLPNDYVCVVFNGLVEEDSENYDFEIDDEIVEIKGNFQVGINDYDVIYFNYSDGTFAEDDDFEDLVTDPIYFGDSNLTLETNVYGIGYSLQVDDVEFGVYLKNIWVNGISLKNNEDNFLTNYGILIENPEDSVEDNEFSLVVPMEQLEGSISLQ